MALSTWLPRLAVLGLLTMAFGCSGTADGGLGDPPTQPHPSEYGSGSRISELLGPAAWLDPANEDSTSCSYPADRNAYVTGVSVVAIDRYDETATGSTGNYYVQDTTLEPKEYSGLTVFDPSFTPPDLRLAPGDVVDMLGVLMEFPGPSSAGLFSYCRTLPEFGGALTFRFDTGVVKPITIPLEDLKAYETARKWLGMLVRVENVGIVAVTDPPSPNSRYQADINVGAGVAADEVPQISNELYDLLQEGPAMTAGTTFTAVTGVLTYFYRFHLAPRSPADFEP